jgi:hypothetical protein
MWFWVEALVRLEERLRRTWACIFGVRLLWMMGSSVTKEC